MGGKSEGPLLDTINLRYVGKDRAVGERLQILKVAPCGSYEVRFSL